MYTHAKSYTHSHGILKCAQGMCSTSSSFITCFEQTTTTTLLIAHCYRIAGNFRGVLIFVIFVTAVAITKFCTPRKFATVGKVVTRKVAVIVIERMDSISGISALSDSVFDY